MVDLKSLCIGAGVLASGLVATYLSRKICKAQLAAPAATTERTLGQSQVATFPWGSDSFAFSYLPHCIAVGAAATAAAIALTSPSGPMTCLDHARGPVLVTLYWVWGFFNSIKSQIMVKSRCGGNEQACKVAERSMMNTLEQGVPFLALFWMTAACVDAAIATSCGFVYCAFRMFYGLSYSYYGGFSMLVEVVTQPNYTVLHVFAGALASFGLGGGSVFALPYLGTNFFRGSRYCSWSTALPCSRCGTIRPARRRLFVTSPTIRIPSRHVAALRHARGMCLRHSVFLVSSRRRSCCGNGLHGRLWRQQSPS